MKNIAFSILILLSINLIAYGQSSKTKTTSTDRPLVFIDSLKTDFAVLVIGPKHIETINVFKDSSAKALYGEAGKFGVVKIKCKSTARLLRINDILEQYHISPADRKLKLTLNKILVTEPALLVVEATEILSVEAITESNAGAPGKIKTFELFLNISTKTAEQQKQNDIKK